MSELTVHLDKEPAQYLCGEKISGTVRWQLDVAPESVEVRLFWRTSGRGDADAGIGAIAKFESPGQEGSRPFTFTTPEGPYTYYGAVLNIHWAVELIALPSGESADVGIVIGPLAMTAPLRSGGNAKP